MRLGAHSSTVTEAGRQSGGQSPYNPHPMTTIDLPADPAATRQFGRHLANCLGGPCAVLLTGPLGAGKTTLAQGIGAGLGVEARMPSPTFTLIREYPVDHPPTVRVLFHVDLYRLEPAEVGGLGLDDLFRDDSVVVIEWADRALDDLPRDALWIRLSPTAAGGRRVTLEARGPTSADILDCVASGFDDHQAADAGAAPLGGGDE